MAAARELAVLTGLLLVTLIVGCGYDQQAPPAPKEAFSEKKISATVGGEPVVVLNAPKSDDGGLQILKVYILPGRSMNIYQMQAYLPGKGTFEMFQSPSLEAVREIMDGGPQDSYGEQSYQMGGAILLPYANRIRGEFLPDENRVQARILDKAVKLPAIGQGKAPGAEKCAVHGLFLRNRMDEVTLESGQGEAKVTGRLDAGDFQGQWLSKTFLTVTATLRADSFVFSVTAKNIGDELLPMGVSWHPYFLFPSGKREQVRLHLPARKRLLVNNYDDVFPTGEVAGIQSTPYDFSEAQGKELGQMYLDDCFVGLVRNPDGHAAASVVDSLAGYGVRVTALSPSIQAFQVAAPTDEPFIAIEPQTHWTDPFSKIWGSQQERTGMAILRPGESVTYEVEVRLFKP